MSPDSVDMPTAVVAPRVCLMSTAVERTERAFR